MDKMIERIARQLNIKSRQVFAVVELLDSGATIPFISRYRKEQTGNLDEELIARIRDQRKQLAELEERRQKIIKSIDEQGKLDDELLDKLQSADHMNQLEDLYLPYKSKRKTRAIKAVEKGLEPLAAIIMSQKQADVEMLAQRFVQSKNEVNTVDEALEGAIDIMAAWINERLSARNKIRSLLWREGLLESKRSSKETDNPDVYRDYFQYAEKIRQIPSHRYLAMIRGENDHVLTVKASVEKEKAVAVLSSVFIRERNHPTAKWIEKAIVESYRRLLLPSLETEIRGELKSRSDIKAIDIFKNNLYQLLMAPPLGPKRVLAIDPGFRSGCKIVCLDAQGHLQENATIYPHPPQNQDKAAAKKIATLVEVHQIEAIAVGNGTAGRETEVFLQKKVKFPHELTVVTVNENGASVYSASKIARKEFPDYDVTVRGAVSIGRRLMDPLAELVKIDPQSIGVGQYQHDVNQTLLAESLDDVVMRCVNAVGVDVNTASRELLSYVSGIGPSLAEKIVQYRQHNGAFHNRRQLYDVPGMGKKSFEQAAGFLRIKNPDQPLDQTAVHPESYYIVQKMAAHLGVEVKDLIRNSSLLKAIRANDFLDDSKGQYTINDILTELEKPGRDPRAKIKNFSFDRSIKSIADLTPGMVVPGQVTNITAFGCFVDIGIKENGLIHVSQLADRFIRDPNEVVVLNQQLEVKVLSVDIDRKRIQLSLKAVNTK